MFFIFKRKKRSIATSKTDKSQNLDDVIVGYEFLATLDFRTCLLCGVCDLKQYKKIEDVPKIIHADCRCVVLPITIISNITDNDRPAEQAPFYQLARERYEKSGKHRSWDSLSRTTKKKYFYEEIKIFETQTGKAAYKQVKNMNFSQWFSKLSVTYQKKYLGEDRWNIFKKHGLSLSDLVDLENMREYTIEELNELYSS